MDKTNLSDQTKQGAGQDVTKFRNESVDDIINRIGAKPTFLMFLISTSGILCSMVGVFCTYLIEFIAYVPSGRGSWSCLEASTKCNGLLRVAEAQNKVDEFYSSEKICDNNLTRNIDFEWHLSRTTMVLDFDLVCKPNIVNLLGSLYFVGTMIALITGFWIFNYIGRRKLAICAAITCTLGVFIGVFCRSPEVFGVGKILQGIGDMLTFSACYIWMLEFMPVKIRLYYNAWVMIIWTFGYPVMIGVCYLIKDWHYIHLALTFIMIVAYCPILFIPESPRYLLTEGKHEEARKVLKRYARLANKPLDLSMVNITYDTKESDIESSMTVKEKLIAFKEHPAMLLEAVILFLVWFVISLLYYGLNFGWSDFGDTPYVNYLFVGLGELIANIMLVPALKLLGRRFGMLSFFSGALLCFLLGMINWQWTEVWNIERLASIIAVMAVTMAFGLVFLYVSEVSPTTHRGMIMCFCSFGARIPAVIGIFNSAISDNRRVKLGINVILTLFAFILTLFLPETKNLPIPETPADVTSRRSKQELNLVRSVTKRLYMTSSSVSS